MQTMRHGVDCDHQDAEGATYQIARVVIHDRTLFRCSGDQKMSAIRNCDIRLLLFGHEIRQVILQSQIAQSSH